MKNFNYRVLVLILTGTAALALAIGIGRFTYTPILPFMLEELNITKTEGGLIASWNFFGYLCGSLLSISSIFKKTCLDCEIKQNVKKRDFFHFF